VTLQALEPMYVDFHLPQQALDRIAVGQPVTARVDTFPDQRFTGTISAINPEVDTETRNVAVRATLANPDHKLLPGMFATVTVNAGAPQRYLTLPQTAITYNSHGNSVYLVEEGQERQ
jgi:membrane fusion protein, multidrug efflux system